MLSELVSSYPSILSGLDACQFTTSVAGSDASLVRTTSKTQRFFRIAKNITEFRHFVQLLGKQGIDPINGCYLVVHTFKSISVI